VAWRGKNATLVRLQLATGRTHQLRVHLAYSGHPIIGDPLYGTIEASRMMLHGIKQQLVLPFTEKIETIQAPIDDEFKQILLKYK
ncbi:RluA family pseudouridine synthase, partial [Eggerthella lenta]|nr:RluA family pseudouridine synthase [Eggerthella lenta]